MADHHYKVIDADKAKTPTKIKKKEDNYRWTPIHKSGFFHQSLKL